MNLFLFWIISSVMLYYVGWVAARVYIFQIYPLHTQKKTIIFYDSYFFTFIFANLANKNKPVINGVSRKYTHPGISKWKVWTPTSFVATFRFFHFSSKCFWWKFSFPGRLTNQSYTFNQALKSIIFKTLFSSVRKTFVKRIFNIIFFFKL